MSRIDLLEKFNDQSFATSYLEERRILGTLLGLIKMSCHEASVETGLVLTPDLRDLARVHWLATSRKAINVLELGSGFSTVAFAFALNENSRTIGNSWEKISRTNAPFSVHSVDESQKSATYAEKLIPEHLKEHAVFYQSDVSLSIQHGKICTEYKLLPNILPDIIYIDGPSQAATEEKIRGISLNLPERMPLSADIVLIEYLLEPGCLLIFDGRTNNYRFLKNILTRNWVGKSDFEGDFHLLELQEDPLGALNSKKLQQTLPNGFLLKQCH